LCKNQSCWEIGLRKERKNRLARALKIELSSEQRTQLLQYGKTFPANERALE